MPERPVECSHCKRPAKICYKEIANHAVTETSMCAECPVLQQKLHGKSPLETPAGWQQGGKEVCCGVCRTTLESVQTGNPLGCSECYTLFSDAILSLLIDEKKILGIASQKEASLKKTHPLHLGKTPNKPIATLASSSQLNTLNEALNEALKKENYEQAAWLRDQIKSLKEKTNERKN
jgi:protein arginine kinase activator